MFWPLLLVLFGISFLKLDNYIKIANSLLGGILASFLVISLFTDLSFKDFSKLHWEFKSRHSMNDGTNNKGYIDYDSCIKTANLDFNAGAGSFEINDTTGMLIFSEIGSKRSGLDLSNDLDCSDSSTNIKVDIDNSENMINNKKVPVNIKLNPLPIWTISTDIGAGEFKFDFTKFKVKSIDLNGGAADINIKIGSLLDSVDINVETGASSVVIMIPKEYGCLLDNSTALSKNSFPGFTKISDDKFQTENYNKTKKCVTIELNGGVSKFTVERY